MVSQELTAGFVDATLDAAYGEFARKGFVVFERVIPPGLIAQMHQAWEEYFRPFQRRHADRNRLLMHLPFKSPLYHPAFVENPLALGIADRVLGSGYVCAYFGSETPLPGADYMAAHFDLAFLKGLKSLNRPLAWANRLLGTLGYYYGLQVSVPLVDSNADNAPFEIWPSTNRLTHRRPPPEVVLMPAGSLLVRDIRNLHRGTPHRGVSPRPFLSIVYLRRWVPRWKPPEIPRDVYDNLPERSKRLFAWARIGQPVPDPLSWAARAR